MDLQDLKVKLVLLVLKVPQVIKDLLVKLVLQVLKDLQVKLVLKDLKVKEDLKV